jgi:hypothetical protein
MMKLIAEIEMRLATRCLALCSTALLLLLLLPAQAGEPAPVQPALAADADRKTAAEWLEVVKIENEAHLRWEAEHPEETKLLLGAALAMAPMLARDDANVKRWEPKYQEAYQSYQDWWQKEGAQGYETWRQAGFPQGTDDTFLIYHAQAINTYHNSRKVKAPADIAAYGDRITKRGDALLLAGMGEAKFGRAELFELRLHAMYVSRIWYTGNNDRLPYNLRWTNSGYLRPGAPAPDFELPFVEELWADPKYKDVDPYSDLDLLRPRMVTRLLQIMTGYEPIPAEERKNNGPTLRARPWQSPYSKNVKLSSFKGQKPVVLLLMDATDTWTWSGMAAPVWEPFYQAVKDKAEVFFIHTVVHDRAMPGKPGAVPFPGARSFHPRSMFDRAWNLKLFYGLYPQITVPYLVDESACRLQNACSDAGGETCVYIVDVNGVVSFCNFAKPACHAYMWSETGVGKEGLGGRSALLMSMVESNLKALLDADGAWKPGTKPVIPDWRSSPMLESVPITAADAAAGTITVMDKERQVTVAVDAFTRILAKGKRLTPADLKAGLTVSLSFRPEAEKPCGQAARFVLINEPVNRFWGSGQQVPTWASARIEAVDEKTATITAKLVLPAREAMKGLAFWEQPAPAVQERLDAAGNWTWAVGLLREWVKAPERTLTIHVDRATDLWLNGLLAKVSDLRVGDRLGIELLKGCDEKDLWPRRLRAYRY